ncbi:DUF3289 family protein [Providencia stuartii]|nr:DUF3289 family protein [Providencia stuartii]MTC94496.1 DUF3289 family protein [Providencia stuartii]OMH52177.1 hypothetical protein BTZ17_06660 [Providencia stuartii]
MLKKYTPTQSRMDDYSADDMRCNDLSSNQLICS